MPLPAIWSWSLSLTDRPWDGSAGCQGADGPQAVSVRGPDAPDCPGPLEPRRAESARDLTGRTPSEPMPFGLSAQQIRRRLQRVWRRRAAARAREARILRALVALVITLEQLLEELEEEGFTPGASSAR